MAKAIAPPNFFILLGLNPDAEWNQSHFEETLRAKRSEWSRRGASTTKKALAARQNLALLDKITEVMTDPRLREKEAQAARAEIKASRSVKHAQFERQLELINAKDFVEQEEVDKFIAAFEYLFSREEITGRIVTLIRPPETPSEEPAATLLEEAIACRIYDRLNMLNMRNLYEFLCRSSKTATVELQRAAEILYTQIVRLPPSAETKARIELAELARTIFQSDQIHAQYDERLRQDGLRRLLQELDEAMSRSSLKEVHQKQVLLFLYEARKTGWKAQEALEELKAHARRQQWFMLPPVEQEVENLLCPSCEKLNEKKQQYCTTCKQPLYVNCPACGKLATCEEAACGSCGFPVGNRYLIDLLLKDLQGFLEACDTEQARKVVKEMELAWSPRGNRSDFRSQSLSALKVQLRLLEATQQQARRDVLQGLRDLSISEIQTGAQHRVQISWPAPRNGQVLIVRTTRPLDLEGRVLPEAQLDQLGEFLARGDQANNALDRWSASEVIYYTPVILFQRRAYIGTSQRYIGVDNVSQLKYQNLGSVLRLNWLWPSGCQEVSITYHTAYWPEYNDPTANTRQLSRAEYERTGCYELHDLSQRDYYIAVYAVLMLNTEKFVASGAYVQARLVSKTVLTYVVKPPTRWHKRYVLLISLKTPTTLPPLLLIYKQGGLPLRKADGDLLCRIELVSPSSQELVIELPDSALSSHTFGKLFFEDDRYYNDFIIHHPSIDQMRLS